MEDGRSAAWFMGLVALATSTGGKEERKPPYSAPLPPPDLVEPPPTLGGQEGQGDGKEESRSTPPQLQLRERMAAISSLPSPVYSAIRVPRSFCSSPPLLSFSLLSSPLCWPSLFLSPLKPFRAAWRPVKAVADGETSAANAEQAEVAILAEEAAKVVILISPSDMVFPGLAFSYGVAPRTSPCPATVHAGNSWERSTHITRT